jgi:hypothetical protein
MTGERNSAEFDADNADIEKMFTTNIYNPVHVYGYAQGIGKGNPKNK